MGFKRYDGTPIEIPTHKHSVEDTQIGGFTAYASYTNDGFMQKEDRIKLTSLKTKMDYLNDRLYNAVYFNEPKSSTLVTGEDFYPKLKEVGPNATSVVFTKSVIPSNKISSATIVSTEDSDVNAYMYLDGDTIYVSPEEDNAIIYANENCGGMFTTGSLSLTSITGLENLDVSNVTNMRSMFLNCEFLTSLDLSNWNTSKVTNMGNMFDNCRALTSITGLEKFNTSNVTNMSEMFNYCKSLTSLDLSNFDTSNVTNMESMFSSCSSLISLDISNWNTSKVTNMNSMFAGCKSLISLDVSSFNTSKVTNMKSMFNSSNSIIGLENFDTSNVTNMERMFEVSKVSKLDLSNFDTSSVSSMYMMFYKCESLTSLDISNWNTSNVTNMENMFYSCYNINSISGIENLDTSHVTNMCSMFNSCYDLTYLNLSNWNTSNVIDMSYMFSSSSALSGEITIMNPNITDYSRMFSGCSTYDYAKFVIKYTDGCKDIAQNMRNTRTSNYHGNPHVYLYEPIYYLITGEEISNRIEETASTATKIIVTNTAIPNTKKSNSILISIYANYNVYMYLDNDTIYISPEEDNVTIYANEVCSGMFNRNDYLKYIDLSNLNTSKVTDMSSMFQSMDSIESINLSGWDTSNVTNMEKMFSTGYTGVPLHSIIGLENFNTSNVTNMSKMFFMCSALSGEITIMNSNIENYSNMFNYCSEEYGTKFTVNYKSGCQTVAQNMVNTKSSKSNVVLGSQV